MTASLDRLRQAHQRMRTELHRVIVGQDEVIDQLLIAILARGHCLLVGVPGLAKTLLDLEPGAARSTSPSTASSSRPT